MIWLEFLSCSALLTFFAYNLCKEGVILSEKTHLEEGVIGMLFLAVATSFPEIVVGATSVFSLGRIGLGYGDLVGSVIVNFMLLFALDYFEGKGRMLTKVSGLNRLTGYFVLGIAAVILLVSLFHFYGSGFPSFKFIGLESVFLVIAYIAYLRIAHKRGTKQEEVYKIPDEPLWKIWGKFALLLVAVMLLGVWMARIGEQIVVQTGISQTFTGALLLGVATSLPEIIVSFTALKAGSVDMAVGNILGSNLFDLCAVGILDGFTEKPILGMLTAGEIFTTVVAFAIAIIVVISFLHKRDTHRKVSWDTILIFAVGFIGFVLLYFIG